jgi:hypothetical protein
MQMPTEEPQEQLQPKKTTAIDYQKQMFELYETTIWLVNMTNKVLTAFPELVNWNPQTQPNPYQFLIQNYQQSSQSYVQQQYSQPQNIYPAPVEEPVNPNVPTFTKRSKPVIEEPEPKVKPPWYKQKGIIFSIILAAIALYFVYIMIMKSQGHSITIPGIGKF